MGGLWYEQTKKAIILVLNRDSRRAALGQYDHRADVL